MSRRKRLILAVITSAGLLIGAGAILAFLAYHDEPPPDTSDLAVKWAQIDPQENGLAHLEAAGRLVVWPQNAPGDDCSDWPQHLADKTLADNAAALDEIDKALACRYFQVPRPEDVLSPVPYLYDWFKLCRCLCLQADTHLRYGREAEAFASAIKLLRLSAVMESGKGAAVSYLVALTGRSMAVWCLQTYPAKTHLTAAEYRALAEEVGACPVRLENLQNVYRAEYEVYANTVDSLKAGMFGLKDVSGPRGIRRSAGPPLSNYELKPNATNRRLAEAMRFQLDTLSMPWLEGEQRRQQRHEEHLAEATRSRSDSLLSLLFRTSNVGDQFCLMIGDGPQGMAQQQARAIADTGMAQLMLALKAYTVEKGELPSSLEALVPDYLKALPIDPFDGGPLKYSRQKRVLYCVGRDGRDLGGMSKEEMKAWARENDPNPYFEDENNPDLLPSKWDLPNPSLPIEFGDP